MRPAFDQLSQFQYDAWAALRKDSPDIVLTIAGQNERFLTGTIPGTHVQVFVYLDQAEVKAGDHLFSGEHYDFDSPAELVDAFIAAAKQWGRPNIAFKPKLDRYAVNMAGTACHVASYALQFGLT